MSPQPFVERPDPELTYCTDCARFYWTGLGHRCDPLAPARGILTGLLVVAGFWVVALYAAWRLARG